MNNIDEVARQRDQNAGLHKFKKETWYAGVPTNLISRGQSELLWPAFVRRRASSVNLFT